VVLVHHHEFLPTSQKISRDFETAAAVQLCGAIGAGGVVSAEFRIRFGWLYDTIAPIFLPGCPPVRCICTSIREAIQDLQDFFDDLS
jgi:hypothetical protein